MDNFYSEVLGIIPEHRMLKVYEIKENWIFGKYKGKAFCAKVFQEKSRFGINNGRVSKLSIMGSNNKIIYNYDRGIDIDSKIGLELANIFDAEVPPEITSDMLEA